MSYKNIREYEFDVPCSCQKGRGLGDSSSQIDSIVENVVAISRSIFPRQTAETEEWIQQRLTNYGIDYAKYKAQQYYGTATDFFSNPIVLLALGLTAGYFVFKR